MSEAINSLPRTHRRRFLKAMSTLLAAPAISPALRYACHELAGGKAFAQAQAQATYFIEFNYRDQVDLCHVFAPPGLVGNVNLRRGTNGSQCTLFAPQQEFKPYANRVYLTNDSAALAPHVDTIAMIDTGEAGIGDIHGHEAANGMRSPGRTKDSNGRMPMFRFDGESGGGNDPIYSRTPTPATLHNYVQKQLDTSLRNGFAFKGMVRYHTVYHFAASLAGAELDRFGSRNLLFGAFPAITQDLSILKDPASAALLTRILRRVDPHFFERHRYALQAQKAHLIQVDEAQKGLHDPNPRTVSLPLTPEEQQFWSQDVPSQKCTDSDTSVRDCGTASKAQVWEQFAWATKVIRSGLVRSVALEFDFMDLHGSGVRTEEVIRTQAKQVAIPLARTIQSLKDAGLYDRTLIAVYALDGSRTPAADSYGDTGKGTVILAGGMIRGGYYGDIEATGLSGDGHTYGFRRPDPTSGVPSALVTSWGDRNQRSSSAAIWQTVASALRVPTTLTSQFDDVSQVRPLSFLLR